MKKFITLFAGAVLSAPVLADPVVFGDVTTGTFGDIENTATVPTAVTLKSIQGGGDISVTEANDVITVSFTSASETDPVWTAEKAGYVQFTDTAFVTATNKADTAVQTVSKANGGAAELTVTQSGTGVTIDVDLSDYAKTADLYVHATDRAQASGFYKITTDAAGHVSAVTAVAAADITGLVPEADDYTAAEAAKVTAATTRLAGIAGIDTTELSTLNEVIAAVQAIVAAAQ